MEKCKFCQADLAENGTFCPNCGKNNAEEEIVMEEAAVAEPPAEEAAVEVPAEEIPAEPKKVTPGKIALAVVAVVVLAAILAALIFAGGKKAENTAPAETGETVAATIPADGNPDDITCKGTYTVTDEEAVAQKDLVVAAMGDAQLTNSMLRIYYRSAISSFLNTEYGYYMMMYGMLDYSKPLDTQLSAQDQSLTWQQYFLRYALENWQLTQALSEEAQKAGVEMSAEDKEYLDTMRQTLEEMASTNDMTPEEMLTADFGPGVSYEDFETYQRLYLEGNPYYEAESAKFVATEEQLEEYFRANAETYSASGVTMDSRYVDVRHILIQIEGGTTGEDGTTTYTDEEWAACEAEAQAILDAYLAGDKTEDAFAALANEKSEDPGSNTVGGLYENVYQGQMVEPFETWSFDENRQYGDTGLVKTSYGYHVMFYVGSSPMWKEYAQTDWTNEQIAAFLDKIVEAYPMDVTYENISLGEVQMA